ncbi:MAG: DegT/DnrJ/EryC1/StrS family aminotransferase [Pseudomonadota bacterium]
MPRAPEDPLHHLIRTRMAGLPVLEHDAAQGMPLQVVGFGAEEVIAATESLLSTFVTMGARVRRFEQAFAEWVGVRHGVMVNSGSSANLLLFAALVAHGLLQEGDEVIVPAVGWSTTLFPVVQAGLHAVIVDVDPERLCLDPAAAARAVGPRTRAAFPVHLLGCAAPTAPLQALGLAVLEDACGAHGAEVGGRRVGSFGLASTFSFFFSHHMTTVEGGIVLTDDPALADTLRSMRAHGWIRERDDAAAQAAAHPETDPRFLFLTPGFNLRPTEPAAAFGLAQLARLDSFVARRRANHRDWCARIAAAGLPLRVFFEPPDTLHAGFSFPLLLDESAPRSRAEVMAVLEARGIATRPISGGNLTRQPAFAALPRTRVPHPLPNADAVHTRGFFVGNSHAFGLAHGQRLLEALQEALRA